MSEENQEPEAVKVTTEKDPWYKRFFRWFCRGAKKLFQVVISCIDEQVTFVLNDPDNQALAVKAIEAAATKGLKGRGRMPTPQLRFVTAKPRT